MSLCLQGNIFKRVFFKSIQSLVTFINPRMQLHLLLSADGQQVDQPLPRNKIVIVNAFIGQNVFFKSLHVLKRQQFSKHKISSVIAQNSVIQICKYFLHVRLIYLRLRFMISGLAALLPLFL